MYVLDTSSIEEMMHFYPSRFKKIWDDINQMISEGKLFSVFEVYKELKRPPASEWKDDNKKIFKKITASEGEFIKEIFNVNGGHFQSCIRKEQLYRGLPVADPFVIASAKINGATVVTEEVYKPKSSKIPNICEYFEIPCINLEQLMEKEDLGS